MSFQINLEKSLRNQNLREFEPIIHGHSGTPKIAVLGKSNVGKSSLINALLQAQIARKGKRPGLTSFVQVFSVQKQSQKNEKNPDFFLLDFPGFGYAQGGKNREKKLEQLIKNFFQEYGTSMTMILYLLDIRRILDSKKVLSDTDAYWLNSFLEQEIPTLIILTKSDKIAKSKIGQAQAKLASFLSLEPQDIFFVSVLKKQGIADLRAFILDYLAK